MVTNHGVLLMRCAAHSQYNELVALQILERLPAETWFGLLHADEPRGWRRWRRYYISFGGKKYMLSRDTYREAQERDALLADDGYPVHFPPLAQGDEAV